MTGIDGRRRLLVGTMVVGLLLVGGLLAAVGPVAAHDEHDDGTEGADEGTNVTVAVDYEGAIFTLHPAPEQEVTGTVSLEAGTEITVALVGTGDDRFQRTRQTTVGEGGTFSATFDLADVPPDARFALLVGFETDNRSVVTDEVKGRIEATTETTETTDDVSEVETTSTTEKTDEAGDAGTTSTDGQPGLGIPGAVLAMLALVALVRR